MGHFHPFPMAMFETTWIHWIPPQLGKLWYFLGTSPLSIAKYGKVSPIDFNIYILYTIYYIVDCQQLGLAEGTPNDGAFRDWGFHPGPFRWPKSFIRNLAVAWWFMDPLQSYHLVI